jgi:hypothetical protein
MIAGRHDTAERKQALRKGREKGCSIYIAAEQLQTAGVDPNGPAPFYRVWAADRGRFIVTLYGAK